MRRRPGIGTAITLTATALWLLACSGIMGGEEAIEDVTIPPPPDPDVLTPPPPVEAIMREETRRCSGK